ncbi:hypothetical protein DKX38_019467 [Salix brachista]|uniref:Uncharacterized protein n=1 Tax=Salix brachista TaxID=2182728 RepID=A0A5N5KGJ6_9ROSI|nr:hypothetical protein DKX38_019467 [Salix brachista]
MEEGNSNNHIANNVARATVAALDWNSTPGARKDAVSFLESLHTQIPISFLLLLIKTQTFEFLWEFSVVQSGKFPVFSEIKYCRSKQEMYEFWPAHDSFLSKGTGFQSYLLMWSFDQKGRILCFK